MTLTQIFERNKGKFPFVLIDKYNNHKFHIYGFKKPFAIGFWIYDNDPEAVDARTINVIDEDEGENDRWEAEKPSVVKYPIIYNDAGKLKVSTDLFTAEDDAVVWCTENNKKFVRLVEERKSIIFLEDL